MPASEQTGLTLVKAACGTTYEDLHPVTMRIFQRL